MGWKKGQSGNPAGRRLSPAAKTRQEVAQKALAEGTTPLEVMLEAMRIAYQEGGAAAAMPYAKEAAPYLHPKLANIEAKMDGVIGTYAAQPIPVEERHSDSLARPNGAAVNGHST